LDSESSGGLLGHYVLMTDTGFGLSKKPMNQVLTCINDQSPRAMSVREGVFEQIFYFIIIIFY
jgi:hypothetical protein